MSASILSFSLAKSNERLTDRGDPGFPGAIALVDEFAEAIRLPETVEKKFPAPGSNAGIGPSTYVHTLIYHFSEGGRHIEEAITHTLDLVTETEQSLRYFRSDSAGYQADVIDLLNDETKMGRAGEQTSGPRRVRILSDQVNSSISEIRGYVRLDIFGPVMFC